MLAEARRIGAEVLVSDDASPDDTADRVAVEFGEVILHRRASNGGFGVNCNDAIARASEAEFVFLANADVRLHPGCLDPLLETIAASDVFAVSSVAVDEAGRVVDGVRRGRFKRGLLKWQRECSTPLDEGPIPTLYAVGAHVLIRRERFLELGGFDELYAPYYWEDVDLCYRAWKRGWRVLCDPRSHVTHEHDLASDIIRTEGSTPVARAIRRNRLLFTWKNLHDPGLFWGRHMIPLLLRTALGWLVLDRRFYRALGGALLRLPATLRGRRSARREARLSDALVLRRAQGVE
jgi:GT2 family glycosyltransferase